MCEYSHTELKTLHFKMQWFMKWVVIVINLLLGYFIHFTVCVCFNNYENYFKLLYYT